MAKVAFLVPYPEMCESARALMADRQSIRPMCVEYTQTAQIRTRVQELEEQGCELIVARGVHASIARQSTKLPIIEIRAATQELGMIMLRLKQELGVDRPRLGLIGFTNMFENTAQYDDLFQIELRSYMVTDSGELPGAAELALADGCQALVGGSIVCDVAKQRGIPFQFLASGEESISKALQTASRVCYAIDMEKHNAAEMDTILDYTFSGIMQVNGGGVVQRVNRACYNLLEKIPGEVIGHSITELLPDLDPAVLEDALVNGRESYALVMGIAQKAAIVNVAPINVNGEIEGVLFTFQEGKRFMDVDSSLRGRLYQHGYIARHSFEQVISNCPEMVRTVALAKRISKYNASVFLAGEPGTGKGILAQCIHNASLRRGKAFIHLDCSAWPGETLDNMLFGNYTSRKDSAACMAEQARGGTLYLDHVDSLPLETQYKLLVLLHGTFLHNGPNQPENADVRIIASAEVNLALRVEANEFRRDLYYALNLLSLELPPLRQRGEDITAWCDLYLKEFQDRYKRYVHLTQGAYQFLRNYDWPGNLDQMANLCERIVLLTEKRSVDEAFLKKQLDLITPKIFPGTDRLVVYRDEKADELVELLRKHGGNRERVAAELGVSKTTLWRRMKKYGIERDGFR